MTKLTLTLPFWGSESSKGNRPVARQGQPTVRGLGMGTPEGPVPRQGQPTVGGLLGGGKIGEDAEEEVGSKGKRSRQR